MQLIRGLHNLCPPARGAAVTIGAFDGVHLGHQAVVGQLREAARQRGLASVLITFEPLPAEYFAGSDAPARITRLRDRLPLLANLGLDAVAVLRFDATLAALAPESFVDRVLLRGLGTRAIIVGDDFRFGYKAAGDYALLERLGQDTGFTVTRQATFELDGQRVSSSRVRQALAQGDFALARRLLGRPFTISGTVAHGDRLGRTIGFPTANIRLGHYAAPVNGVFAVRVGGVAEQPVAGMANVGMRPTVAGKERRLEVHLFDFSADIYGRKVTVEFVSALRPEQRFESLDALKAQIARDELDARAALASTTPL